MSGGIIGAMKRRKKRLENLDGSSPAVAAVAKPKPKPSGDLRGLRAKNPYQGSSTVVPTFKSKPKLPARPRAQPKVVDRSASIAAGVAAQKAERRRKNAARAARAAAAMKVLGN